GAPSRKSESIWRCESVVRMIRPASPRVSDRSTEKLFAFALVRPHFRNLAADPDRVPLMG
ncbi:MAG TPA: hypothetical protein VG096_08080, partial [Bryobacteraceae bacterium]|nr:hypothetical protein [Bryobacteraceae bacterium]